jgi:hypothetical protein
LEKEGRLPSIKCPINCPNHAGTKIKTEIFHNAVSNVFSQSTPKTNKMPTHAMPKVIFMDKRE